MSVHKRHAKNALALIAAGGLSKILVMLVAVFAFKGLSVADAGTFNYAFSMGFVFALFTEIGIRGYLLRELARRRDDAPAAAEIFGDILNTRLLLCLVATPVIAAVMWGNADTGAFFLVMAWFYLYALIDSVSMTLKFALRAYERMELDALFSVIGRLFVFLPVVWFWHCGTLDIPKLIVAHLGGAAVECIGLLLVSKLIMPVRWFNPWCWTRIRSILIKSAPFAVINLIGLLYLRTALIALEIFHGTGACALFSAAERFPEAALFLPTAIVNALIPTLARSKNDPALVRRIYGLLLRLILMIALAIATVIVLRPQTILLIISKPAYLPAATALVLCGIWMVGAFTQYVTANVLTCLDQEKWVMRRYTIMCVFNIAVTFALVPRYGVTGAAVALAASQLLASAIDIVKLSALGYRLAVSEILIAFGIAAAIGAPIMFIAGYPGIIIGLVVGATYFAAVILTKDRALLAKTLKRNPT